MIKKFPFKEDTFLPELSGQMVAINTHYNRDGCPLAYNVGGIAKSKIYTDGKMKVIDVELITDETLKEDVRKLLRGTGKSLPVNFW